MTSTYVPPTQPSDFKRQRTGPMSTGYYNTLALPGLQRVDPVTGANMSDPQNKTQIIFDGDASQLYYPPGFISIASDGTIKITTTNAATQATATFAIGKVDLSGYYDKTQIDTKLTNYETTAALNTALVSYYTSAQIDTKLANYETTSAVSTTLANYYTSTQVDSKIASAVSTLPANGAWVDLSLLNGWTAYTGRVATPQYRKDLVGRVQFRGIVDGASSSSTTVATIVSTNGGTNYGTKDTLYFVLPATSKTTGAQGQAEYSTPDYQQYFTSGMQSTSQLVVNMNSNGGTTYDLSGICYYTD